MSQSSPSLDLPYIQAAQAQKHVTHNEAIERLDLLAQLVVRDFLQSDPPADPIDEGLAWIIPEDATGVWAGRTDEIASWRGGGWLYLTPKPGWRAWGELTGDLRVYDGADWVPVSGGADPGPVDFDNLTGVGINASSDPVNRLSVSADATLLNNEGAGHQLKLNKAAAADTASLVYQTGFSGRAEMGTAGTDDFSIKVSADGATWTEALRVTAATGQVDLPATPARQILPYPYRHYFYADKRWCVPSNSGANFNANQGLGTGAEPSVNWQGKGLFVPAGAQLIRFVLAGSFNSTEVIDIDLRVFFQYGPWATGWNSNGDTLRDTLFSANSAGALSGNQHQLSCPLSYTAPADGYVFAAIRADAASTLTATRYYNQVGALELACPAFAT